MKALDQYRAETVNSTYEMIAECDDETGGRFSGRFWEGPLSYQVMPL